MRPIYEIAQDIRKDWRNVYFGAVPYLEAMHTLESVHDRHGYDSAKSIISYFLANASSWRGEKAKQIKQELKQIIK
jgi:hypothetical protein